MWEKMIYICILITLAGTVAGQLILKHAMRGIGEIPYLAYSSYEHFCNIEALILQRTRGDR